MLASELKGNTDNTRDLKYTVYIIGVGAAGKVLKGFCEITTEPQNVFLHLRKERNKC